MGKSTAPSDSSTSPIRTIIVMGVSGCGKSLIGSMLAEATGGTFNDADDFHPLENKAKMSARIPLTDEDRWPWLRNMRQHIETRRDQPGCCVLACSALKRVYRDILRGDDSPETLRFIYLRGTRELIASRLAERKGHFMPPSLLASQFATLEEPGPEEAIAVSIDQTPEEIVTEALSLLRNSRN